MLYIKSEAYVSEKGRCAINEDTLLLVTGQLYLICDGVGGNANGQVASKLVADALLSYYENNPDFELSTALIFVEKALSQYKKKNPSKMLMASTLALTQIKQSSILIAWIGDSTVYQIRDGHLRYKTKGHTWVNEAIEKGELTELEQYFHPNKNEVTRLIKGTQQRSQFDCQLVTDLEEHDYFLLISDGVLEAFIEDDLIELFNSNNSCAEILKEINKQSTQFSNDNYSAIIYQIGIDKKL
jgi:serine/threonine protein phosphatase PrpC